MILPASSASSASRITSYNVCYTKLLRAYLSRRQGEQDGQQARLTIPWFVLGFILAAGVNTWVTMPATLHQGLGIAKITINLV